MHGYGVGSIAKPEANSEEIERGAGVSGEFVEAHGDAAQILDLGRRRLALGIPGQSLLARLQEFCRSSAIKALGDPLAPTQFGNQRSPQRPDRTTQIFLPFIEYRLCVSQRIARTCSSAVSRPGFLSHLRSLAGYDESETLCSLYPSDCITIADGGHCGIATTCRRDESGLTPP